MEVRFPMKITRKMVAIAAAVAALAAGGVGIAYAVDGGGDSEEQVTGPDAERAKQAALDATGGGTVSEVEFQDSDGAGQYEVEVQRDDGSQVEVHLNDQFEQVGTAADDDTGSDSEDDDGAGDDD
jgi:uncharacterized membrane protein YkoI